MDSIESIFEWIDQQHEPMVRELIRWSNINSYSLNPQGLKMMGEELFAYFSKLDADIQWLPLDPYPQINAQGEKDKVDVHPMLSVSKRLDAKFKILCVIHMDTVYPLNSAFQQVTTIDEQRLNGPGIADAKGGIMVLYKFLEAIERSSLGNQFGWQVFINPDEEIGSPASGKLLIETAKNFDLGMVFEPSLENGHLVSARKASGNFTLVVRGRSAHAGRDHSSGINAIDALAHCVAAISHLSNRRKGLTVNVGQIQGGTALNVVPDLALAHFNVRCFTTDDQHFVEQLVQAIIRDVIHRHQVSIDLHGYFSAPAKPLDEDTLKYLTQLRQCGQALKLQIDWSETGGVCDGNRLASAGLPTVDTLGVRGGKIHSTDEFIWVDSLTERVKLITLFMYKQLKGEFA